MEKVVEKSSKKKTGTKDAQRASKVSAVDKDAGYTSPVREAAPSAAAASSNLPVCPLFAANPRIFLPGCAEPRTQMYWCARHNAYHASDTQRQPPDRAEVQEMLEKLATTTVGGTSQAEVETGSPPPPLPHDTSTTEARRPRRPPRAARSTAFIGKRPCYDPKCDGC